MSDFLCLHRKERYEVCDDESETTPEESGRNDRN